jgi:mRNA interferase RelE/StbE
VRYETSWALSALDRAAGFLAEDKGGVSAVMDAVDDLAADPRPQASARLTGGLRRLHVGPYRVVYEIDDARQSVTVVHLGRVG